MSILTEYLPFLIPLIIIDVILAFTALIHVLKHPKFRFGNKYIWIPVVLLVQLIGPLVYFTLGRGDD